MYNHRINRRRFLMIAGGALGASAMACCGITAFSTGLFDETPPAPSMLETTYGENQMNNKILVTYASQGGATAGIADAVGQALSTNGVAVDVRPVTSVTDLSPYQAVIVGSAIHGGKWMPEALAFIDQHQNTLRQMPTAIFQVCMMMATDSEQYKRMVPDWMSPVKVQIHPVAENSFAGALWPNQYAKFSEKLGLRIFLATIKLKAGDYRDWDAIRAWAESLRPLLLQ